MTARTAMKPENMDLCCSINASSGEGEGDVLDNLVRSHSFESAWFHKDTEKPF